jgi:hypothetical protein
LHVQQPFVEVIAVFVHTYDFHEESA